MYLEELRVLVHQKQHQDFTLGSGQFLILENRPLKCSADQSPVISLTENTWSVIDSLVYTLISVNCL